MNDGALPARRRRLPGRGAPLFRDRPPRLGRGAAVPVRDGDGHPCLDACDDAPHIGHGHPHVVEARAGQAGTIDPSTRHPDERTLDCAGAALITVAATAASARAIVSGPRERGAPVSRTGRLDNLRGIRPPMPFSAALDGTPAALP